jgi:hypothetical protein
MKATRTKMERATLAEIREALARVPGTQLQVVREVVRALARSSEAEIRQVSKKKESLLDTPFCGLWSDRTDIADGQTFARTLRESLETRDDRNRNIR